MSFTMVHGKFLIVDAQTVIENGAIVYSGDQILQVGNYDTLREQYSCSCEYGSDDVIVAPGFVNAHGHGRGLTDFQLGTKDDVLEAWKYRVYPGVNSYYDTMWRAMLMVESGITSTMHNHNLTNPGAFMDEFHTAIDAYKAVGLRVAFAPTLIDDHIVLYGDRDKFLRDAHPDTAAIVLSIEQKTRQFGLAQYLSAVEELMETRKNNFVEIIHAPLAPQWCTQESLEAIAGHAHDHNLRVHIHVLQTVLQREYARRYLPGSMIDYLADVGLLGERTTCGHAIWLTEKDICRLSETGTSVTTHSSCNLRIQSGLSPVRALLNAGIRVGLGMDDKTLNDQKDFFSEMRLTARLHRLGAYRMLDEPLSSSTCFRMATEWSAGIIGFTQSGTLHPGKNADIVLMNYIPMIYPYTYTEHSPMDILLYRGAPQHIQSVIVGGRLIYKDGEHLNVDKEEIAAHLTESLSPDYAARFKEENRKFERLKQSLSDFYQKNGWYDDLENTMHPYYPIHNRV